MCDNMICDIQTDIQVCSVDVFLLWVLSIISILAYLKKKEEIHPICQIGAGLHLIDAKLQASVSLTKRLMQNFE